MFIKKIELINFRNYEKEVLELSKFTNVILGDNAQGKTNLLEAIYVCAFGKSFRSNSDSDLIKNGRGFYKLKIHFYKNNRDQEIEIVVKNDRLKQISKNGSNLTSLRELFGSINLILFYPDDLKLIKSSPGERRKFIDRELSNLYPAYITDLLEYNKILNQRNELLKVYFRKNLGSNKELKDAFRMELDIWDEKLVDVGTSVLIRRMEFLYDLNKFSLKYHSIISEYEEKLNLSYLSSIDSAIYNYYIKNYRDENNKNIYELQNYIKNIFKEKIKSSFDEDIRNGHTKYGIHKDDIEIFINELDAKKFASQGQQRTAILAMKMAEIEMIKILLDDYPVLLLDDVMSELDSRRQSILLKRIDGFQTIITTTDLSGLKFNKMLDYKRIFVKNGSITQEFGGEK